MRRRRLGPLLRPQLHRTGGTSNGCGCRIARGRRNVNRTAATNSPALAAAAPAAATGAAAPATAAPLRCDVRGPERTTACQSGDASACGELLPVVEAECAQKIPAACRFAGFLYERGRGVAANAALAASFYNQSCEAGDKMGCVGFALLQARGTGVIQNEAKAQATLSGSVRRGSWRPACSSRC